MRLSTLTLLACAAAVLASCDSATNPGGGTRLPPDSAVPIALDSTVVGTLDVSGEDEFVVNVASTEFRVALQARSGNAGDTVVAEIFDDTKVLRGTVSSAGNGPVLGAQAGPWLKPASGGTWRVRVRRQSGAGGPYSLRLFSRNPAPEHAAAEVVSGQTVESEKVDVVGDLDTFRFTGRKGEDWVIFLQPTDAYSWMTVQLVEEATGKTVGTHMVTHFAWSTFWSLRMSLPEDGTYLVRVWGEDVALLPGYRFGVKAVNPAPERGDALVEAGQVVAEEIGSIADVDEYRFTVPAGLEALLALQLEGWTRPWLSVDTRQNGAAPVRQVTATRLSSSLDNPSTRRLLSAGEYVMRLSSEPSENFGQYRFTLSFHTALPDVGGVVTLNGPPVESVINEPSDVDEYPFTGTRGDLLVIQISSPSTPPNTIVARIPLGMDQYWMGTRAQGARPGYSQSRALPYTGTYTLRVHSEPDWQAPPAYRVPYSVQVYTVPLAPEHIPAEIQVGERVEGERLDRAGDQDRFAFMGQAGQEVNLFMGTDDPDAVMHADVVPAEDPHGEWSYPAAKTGSSALDGASTGRFTLEARPYHIYVKQSRSISPDHPYTLRVFPIDRRPEGRAQAYVAGDTVVGEPLYPAGDIDEYTFTLGAPATVDVFWDAPFTAARDEVTARLTSEATGVVHWTSRHTVDGVPVRRVALPAGSYRISILNENVDARASRGLLDYTRAPTLRYRFALTPR